MIAASIPSDVDIYLEHLRVERQLSSNTIDAYRRDLLRLVEFAKIMNLPLWEGISTHHARTYSAKLHGSGLSPRSIQRILSSARGFYTYLLNNQQARVNPFSGVRSPKSDKKLPRTLDVDQVGQLLDISGQGELAIRDRALMELIYSSGLRLAELCSLNLEDLMLDQGLVRVTGKGRKTREVPVGRVAIGTMRAWLNHRATLPQHDPQAVFVSRLGHRISPRSVQARITYWARKQGVGVAVSPHMLRHSFASHLLESSGELRSVQELLGHANISTTQIYTHLDFQHLASVYDRAHPRAKKIRDESK